MNKGLLVREDGQLNQGAGKRESSWFWRRLQTARRALGASGRRVVGWAVGWAFLPVLLFLIFYLARIVWTRRWETIPGMPGPAVDEVAPPGSDTVTELGSSLPPPAQAKPATDPRRGTATKHAGKKQSTVDKPAKSQASRPWWRKAEGWLLFVESAAVLFVVLGGVAVWMTLQDLNDTYRDLHQADPRILPTVVSAANPLLSEVQLPPMDPGRDVPQLLPESGAMAAPPLPTPQPTATPAARETPWAQEAIVPVVPTPAPDYAQRLQIPAIGVDSHVFQSNDPRALKLGVAQFGYFTAPGQAGNLVIAGHNDTYGEIFRDLGELERGDEVTLFGSQRTYTYRVRDKIIVEPEDVWVMLPTSSSTLTLITCHPYLIDSHRLVVFAELVE